MWRHQTIGYKSTWKATLPDELNTFYAYFDLLNKESVVKSIPPPEEWKLSLFISTQFRFTSNLILDFLTDRAQFGSAVTLLHSIEPCSSPSRLCAQPPPVLAVCSWLCSPTWWELCEDSTSTSWILNNEESPHWDEIIVLVYGEQPAARHQRNQGADHRLQKREGKIHTPSPSVELRWSRSAVSGCWESESQRNCHGYWTSLPW